MYADENWRNKIWYEAPREDPEWPEVHTYTDAISYEPGQTVVFHGSTTAQTWSIQIYRDGYKPTLAHRADAMPGQFTAAPKDAYKAGCGWPVVHRWTIPGDTPSGFYRVISSCLRKDGSPFVQHHFFVVRPTPATRRGRILMILPTATWTSYNDWGGASHYIGVDGPTRNQFSPVLSLLRPWTRGAVWLPEGAPRIPISPQPGPLAAPRYPIKEWSYTHGFGYYYAASGWAQYDRYFVQWAEREGYAFDMITQTDLHFRPEMIADYPCIVIVGHDEYWSHEMRTTIERHIEGRSSRALRRQFLLADPAGGERLAAGLLQGPRRHRGSCTRHKGRAPSHLVVGRSEGELAGRHHGWRQRFWRHLCVVGRVRAARPAGLHRLQAGALDLR
jgi:hypothetical protein